MNDIDIKKQQREQFLKGANTKDKGLGGHALDAGLSLLSGAVSVPEAVVGLADIPTGGRVGKFLENEGGALGFRPKEAKEAIAAAKTERSRQQLQDFQEAEGFGAKFGQALENKSLITNTVLESLPAMGAGGVVGRGLGAVAPRIGGVAAGALGEGAVGAGLQAESIRQQTDDGLLTAKQSGLAAATGATTAGFGYAGGRLAKELGIGDVDTMFATGSRAAGTRAAAEGAESAGKQKSMVRRALEGALTEGLLEELPQSVSETVLQNIALNRPLEEGVDEAAVLGILSGGVMGAGAGAATRGRAPSANDNAGTDDAQLVATEDMGQEVSNYGAPKSNVAGLLGGPSSSAPQLGFSGTPADQYNVGPDGDVFTADQYNDYLAGQRYQDAAARDAGMKGFNDVSQTPEGYEQFGSDPQLPPPRSDYEVRPDGTVLSPEDFNADLQAQREQDAARLAARMRGEITDNTQVPQEATGYGDLTPSQQMGLDPNKGSLSAAAALAVDSGASQRMMAEQQAQAAVEQGMMTQASTQAEPMQNTRMAGLVEVENQEQPTGSKWLQGMRSSLANADPNDANYQTVAAAIEADPKSVPERARLKKQVESLAKRPEPTVKTVNPKARVLDEAKAKSVAYNPRGDEIPTQFDVVDASELVSSHSNNFVENPNYPQQYQPRDRAKAGYQAQVLEIFNKFKPNLLGDDNSVNAGSPIVGPNDNLVESGNGRTIAIRKIYEAGKGDAYRQFVNEQAEKFGLDTNAINNMQQPVLVRRNMSGMDRETFALRANDPVGSEMSSGERAQSDAKNLPNTDLLELDSSGSLNIKGSIKFTQQFIKSMSTAEVNNLVMEDGQLSKTGQNRVSGALLHSAYNSPKLTSAVTEDMDATAKNTLKALVDKAPQIAKINQAVKEGKREPTTLAEDIKTAAETYINLVETEANIDDYLNMDDMFGDGISQQAKEIVRDFYNNPRSTVRMGAALQARIDEANRSNAPDLLADFEADAPNVLSNDPAPTNAQTATQLTDENPTVNIPAPKKAPRELSDKAMVREMQKPTTKNTETDYRAALNLSEGQNLGRLIMSSGRVFDDVVVKSMDDKGVTVEATVNGKRGLHKGMQYQTVDAGINNTKSYAKQQAAKDKPPQAPVTKPETNPEPAVSERDKHIKAYKDNRRGAIKHIEQQGLKERSLEMAGLRPSESITSLSLNAQSKLYADLIEEGMAPMGEKTASNSVDPVKETSQPTKIQEFKQFKPSGKTHAPTLFYGRVDNPLIGENIYGQPVYEEAGGKSRYIKNSDGGIESSYNHNPFDEYARIATMASSDPSPFNLVSEVNTLNNEIAATRNNPKFSRAAGLSETAELKDLIVAHNLRSEGVLAAAELGGLAAPSIAVVRAEISDFTSYGEITLLADPLLLSGKSMPTFDADIYSPRQPRASYNVNTKKFRDFEKTLSEAESFGLEVPNLNSLEYTSGFDSFKESAAVRYEYLKSINKLPKIKNEKVSTLVKRAAALGVSNYNLRDDKKVISMATSEAKAELRDYSKRVLKGKSYDEGTQNQQEDIAFFKSYLFNDDGSANDEKIRAFVGKVTDYRRTGGVDQYSFRRDISEAVHSEKHRSGYNKWSKDKFETFLDGKRLDMGEDRNGNTKYKPYNLDNVVREMTRNLRNGEGYFYGSGSIRSQYANELKGIKDIQKSRNKIISKEAWDNKVKEIDIAFDQFLEAMQPFYKGEIDYEYQSKASEAMAQGNHAIAKEFNLTSESRKLINGIQQYLADQPTEYFEAKAQRAVQFHEFDTAVVPKNADPEAVKVLRDAGVKIRRYDQNVEGDKNRIIAQQTKLMFSKPENERANPSAGEKVKGSTNTTRQQVLAKLNDKFGKETIDKLMAAGKLDIKTLNDFAVDGELTIPSDVDGLYHNGKATLIADNLSDDMIIPTFLHELGGHGGMQTLMDKKSYDALMKDFDAMVKAGDPLAMQAKAMADKVARNEQDALDEYLPYLITLASRKQAKQGKLAGMINRMVMAIRSWLKNTLGVPIAINSQDILSLAERMVNEVEKQSSTSETTNVVPQFSDPNIPDKQMQDVRDQYENTDQWMTAPNGKPTNLTENQWLQVRTPAFKQWFGDWEGDPDNASKVVDGNGEPMVVYHGTQNEFTEFDIDRLGEATDNTGAYGQGFYFAPDFDDAKSYSGSIGTVGEYFLNIRNILQNNSSEMEQFAEAFDVEKQSVSVDEKKLRSLFLSQYPEMKEFIDFNYSNDGNTPDSIIDNYQENGGELDLDELGVFIYMNKRGKLSNDNVAELEDYYSVSIPDDAKNMQWTDWLSIAGITADGYVTEEITDAIKDAGYDGVSSFNMDGSRTDINSENEDWELLAFNPNQIKSATGNVGTFDNSNPDIRFSNPNIPDKKILNVRDKYEGTGEWLKAPNGEDTNLTEQQWLQVRTPAFKEWFGDWEGDPKNASKIVDDNGEPMVVYHGTQSDPFHTFDPNRLASNTGNEGWYGSGHYFTPDEYTASEYGDTEIPVFLNIRNPMLEDGESIGQYAKKVGHKVDIDILDFNYIADLVVEINPLLKDMVDKKISKNKDISEKDTYDKYISNGGLPNSHYGQMMSDHLSDSNDTLSYGVAETIMSGAYINNDYLRLLERLSGKAIPDDKYQEVVHDDMTIPDLTKHGKKAKEATKAFKDDGYDGVWAEYTEEIVAFNPNQIKSAINNAGTFDNSNPDIRFSRAAGMSDPLDPVSIAKQAGQRFQDWATSKPAGKVSWWHNTVGTMYNLAERNPLFKPVYEHTEKFINDVSFYAAKASEMAPRLLPKLDSWRDLSKTAVSAKDNEAISKPIFEGTLIWGRDLNGKAVLIDDWRKKVMATSKQDRLNMLRAANRITPAQEAELAKLNAVQANRFINGIIDDEVSAGLVWTDSELRSKFNLSDEHIELYREFRATTDNSLDSMTRSDMLRKLGKNGTAIEKEVMEAGTLREAVYIIEQHANSIAAADPSKSTAMSKVVTDVKASAYRSTKLMDDGYAPLSRFGKFTVDVVDAAGEREYFGLFESAYEARKMADEMRELYGDDAVTQGALSEQEFKLFAGVTPETAELFGEMLGLDATGDKDSDDAFQEYLRRTKNNRSTMKRLMHRKGIKGYSEDVGRVLASFVYSNARHTSAALNMGNLDRSISDIPKSEGQLKDVAIRLAQYIKNPQEEGHVIRGFMFAQYLGGSVASAAVNLTQPIAVSFPYLSQFGGAAKAAAEIGRAAKDWASGSNFNAELTREIARAEADGTLSPQEVHNLLRMARGQNPLAAGDGTKYGNTKAMAQNAASRVGVAWGALFSLAEQANRRVTFVAAYRMAKDQGMADPAEFARKSIKETQFVYNKASRMRWGRGAVGGTVMTFKTYSVSYIELMHRLWNQGEKGSVERKEGRKAAMLMVATIFLLSGTGGLPFMEDAEDVIDGFGQMIGYNMNTRKARDEFLDEIFGEMAGDFLESGISSIHGMPTDISSRLGMDNLIPATGIFKERTNNTRDVMELAGPAGDFISRSLSGARTAVQGAAAGDARQVGRGALETMPVAVRNAFKGADMLGSGIYKDTKGYKVIDTSPLDAAVKAIGFQPKNVSKAQNANYLAQSELAFYTLRAAQIRALWAQGVSEKNKGKVDDARAALANWNSRNPDQPITIRPTDIARRVREMNMTKDQRTAKRAPTALRSKIADQLQDAND